MENQLRGIALILIAIFVSYVFVNEEVLLMNEGTGTNIIMGFTLVAAFLGISLALVPPADEDND